MQEKEYQEAAKKEVARMAALCKLQRRGKGELLKKEEEKMEREGRVEHLGGLVVDMSMNRG